MEALKKLNRLCFRMMGDMNWHAHCGIFTYPVRVAVEKKIPLIIWGEHGFTDLAGMHSLNDRVEMTAKYRLEHAQRGYDWHDMVEETEGLTRQDMLWARYPTDEELADVGVRGIYLGNYVDWEANAQTDVMKEWGFEPRRSRSSAPTAACRTSTTCTRTASTTTSSSSSSATAAAPTTPARTSARAS